MISKPVPAHSFYHTARYVAKKPGAELLIAEGVRGHDFTLMAEDFIRQQQMRPSKEKACFHSILSFYPGEKPSDATMKEIAQRYLQELGIVNTQFAVSKHTDKVHLHLHIVANMVDNDGKAISDSWIGLRGKKVAQRLTEEYKLIPALGKNLQLIHLEALGQSEADKYHIYQAISEALPGCRSLEELESRLLAHGIEIQYKYKGQTRERQGISFKTGNSCFKGSQVDRKFSLAGLEKAILFQQRQPDIPKKEQTKKPIPRPGQSGQSFRPARPVPGSSHSRGHSDSPAGSAGVGKLLEILLTAEETGAAIPYELTEDYLRRKKKKRRRH